MHNTVINSGRGANLSGWDNRPGLVFANNVIYSLSGDAVRWGNGSAGVTLTGNVFQDAPTKSARPLPKTGVGASGE